jgi:L-ribulose-5-phosphate 4-epimerase
MEEAGRGKAATNSEAQERQLREQVAACTLILNDLHILGYSGHISARLPHRDAFLIQSFDQSRAALTPEQLLICDTSGRMLSGPDGQRPPAEIFLHSEILRARPDVNSVAHFHHDRTTAFTLVDDVKLAPIKNHAVRWASGIPVHGDPNHVNSVARGQAVAQTLGSHHALLVRAHGQIVVAESVPALLVDCVHFVENAMAMYDASLLGKVRPLSEEEIASFRTDLKRDRHIAKLWTYYTGRARTRGFLPQEWQL